MKNDRSINACGLRGATGEIPIVRYARPGRKSYDASRTLKLGKGAGVEDPAEASAYRIGLGKIFSKNEVKRGKEVACRF